jgi:hypothetical protein
MDVRSGSVRKLRRLWRRLGEVGPPGWLLLARTFCLLLAAKIALRVLPVRRVIAWKQRAVRSPQAADPDDRRGIESRLHYGVTRSGAALVTHTWLEAGGEILIGGEVAASYSTLAVY